mgnify:CR=1 FL=1
MQTHGPILEDHRIGQLFRLPHGGSEFLWRPIERQVNLGHLCEDAETSSLGSKELKEGLERTCCPVCCCSISKRCGQSTTPATVAPTCERHGHFQVMQHTVIISHGNGQHPCCIDRPCIVWLPTTARVEGGLIEHHHSMAVLDKTVHHLSGKLGEMGIVPVKFRGHSIMHHGCLFPLQCHVRVDPETVECVQSPF